MKKILAFAASNSRQSINKALVTWAGDQLDQVELQVIDLNDYEMPIYSIDRQNESGFPDRAYAFREQLKSADGIMISFAEYNGSYTAAFKNIFDWVSRIDRKLWGDKPMFLLSTAPGPRGGITVLNAAKTSFPFMGGQIIGVFSLPKFKENFEEAKGIVDEELKSVFYTELHKFQKAVEAVEAVV